MNKERGGFWKEMTFPKAAALAVAALVLTGVSIYVIKKLLIAKAV